MYRQDARHWIAVYRQMISFKDELLARMRAQARNLPPAARRDVMDNDVSVLELQLRRYQRRIEFWYARQWELEGLSVEEATRTIGYREQLDPPDQAGVPAVRAARRAVARIHQR